MVDVNQDIPTKLQEDVGDALRVVATHDGQEYEFQYRRQDITEGYTPDEFQRIFDDLILEGMEREYFEQLFHVGALECGAWGFEEAAIFYFPAEDYSGLVVSVDRDGPIDIDGLIETCKDAVVEGSNG